MKKLLKSDKLIILIASICIIGILSIAFFLVGPFIRDKFTRLENFKQHYLLDPGIYEIGTHIPEGTYYVRSDVEETCYFDIYELEEDYMYCRGEYQVRDKNKLMQPFRGKWGVEIKNRKKNIDLENGRILMIRPNTQLLFYSNDANIDDLNSIENSTLKTYKLVNRAVAGQDFKTGVYDIIYEPTDSEQNGTVTCVIKFVGTYESEFTMTFHCSGKDGSRLVYKNVPFTSDSTIATNIQGITLVPTKKISETFNEITGD